VVSSVTSAEIVATPWPGAEGRDNRHPHVVLDRAKSSTAVDNDERSNQVAPAMIGGLVPEEVD
jgi:hypothetical protein